MTEIIFQLYCYFCGSREISVIRVTENVKRDKKEKPRGAWVVQSVQRLALDSGSGQDLRVPALHSAGGLLGGSPSPHPTYVCSRVPARFLSNK